MARKQGMASVFDPTPIDPATPRMRQSDRWEQEYELPDQWTSMFLNMMCEPYGAISYNKKRRGEVQWIVVQAADLETLARVQKELARLYAPLWQALAGALYTFCETHLPPKDQPKR